MSFLGTAMPLAWYKTSAGNNRPDSPRYFPDCQAINMDGTITNIQAKSQEELRALREAGIRHLYLGIESGLDDVLRYMGKDHNLDQAYTVKSTASKAQGLYSMPIS